MFQPETEDMLPRAAPKPSTATTPTEAIVRPTVPEVSILFGQPTPQQLPSTTNSNTEEHASQDTPTPTQPQQTYAAWKKQVQPKVTFPPIGEEVYSIDGQSVASSNAATTATPLLSNVYPLRTMTASIAPIISYQTAMAASNTVNSMQYRRSLDSLPVYSLATTTPTALNASPQWLIQQRRSLESAGTQVPVVTQVHQDVLTICAGTQTDNNTLPAPAIDEVLHKLITKTEFEQLLTLVQNMRMEQLRLLQICEALLVQQQQQQQLINSRTFMRDVSTQCNHSPIRTNEKENSEPPPAQQFAANNPFQLLQQYQSPRSAPAAQSTAYHANTPIRPALLPTKTTNALPKTATDKSMVMNELALKYLPSEKLNELLEDLNIAQINTATTKPIAMSTQTAALPLRNIENLDKGPSDISNASYKYLKKYRLLPEENECGKDYAETQSPAIDLCSPLNVHRTESPYQRVPSPLMVNTAAPAVREQLLDLEHIRRQPKFL